MILCSESMDMTAEVQGDAQLEIGHVLFMDVVGYSKLLVDEQSEITHRINQIVKNTAAFRASESAGKLLRLPTGDGMVLVFFDNPEAPVRCAVEIAKKLRRVTDFALRMGIHVGPVNRISDVNEGSNVAGGGINFAQRVMDCGDGANPSFETRRRRFGPIPSMGAALARPGGI